MLNWTTYVKKNSRCRHLGCHGVHTTPANISNDAWLSMGKNIRHQYCLCDAIIKSLILSDKYMRQWNRLLLVPIMACRLLNAKPLCEPILLYCQLEPKDHTSVKFWLKCILLRKSIWKCRLENCGHFVSASICWHGFSYVIYGTATWNAALYHGSHTSMCSHI